MAKKIYLYDNEYDCIGTGTMAAEYIQYQLLDAAGDDVEVHISSVGGDAFQAVAIYDILKRYAGNVTTYIDSVAASAAATIAMAGKTVIMSKYALLMIHKPATYTGGTADDLSADVAMLDAIQKNIVSIYMDKTGMDIVAVEALVNATTWLTADEALTMGFIDQVEDYVETAPIIKNAGLVSNFMQTSTATPKQKQVLNKLLEKPAPGQQSTENMETVITEEQRQATIAKNDSLLKKVWNLFKPSIKKVVTNKGDKFVAGNIAENVAVFNDDDMDTMAEDATDVVVENEAGTTTFNIAGGKATNVVNKKKEDANDDDDMDDDSIDADNHVTLKAHGINASKKEVSNKAITNNIAGKLREVTNRANASETLLIEVRNQLAESQVALSKTKEDIKNEILSEFVPTNSQRQSRSVTNNAIPEFLIPKEGSLAANAVKKAVNNKA